MHAVDVEEERHHVQEDHLVAGDHFHGMGNLGEHAANDVTERVLAAALTTSAYRYVAGAG